MQAACARLMTAIYEQDFLDSSYGYRPGRGAGDAVKDLTFDLQYGSYGYLVEADVQGFFDHLDHDKLLEMLSLRIDDRAFVGLIRKWLKAGILEPEGHVVHPDTGTPQGGIVSPVVANAYLHYVLDLWFAKVVKPRCKGEALLCRYADDWVCAFRLREDAERFYRVLPKRLEKFNLTLAPEKTRLLRFSRFHPSMRRRFTFLGFEFFWKEDRKGTPRVMRRTARKRLQGACRRIKEWIQSSRHLLVRDFFDGLNRRLRGHYNYYGVRGQLALAVPLLRLGQAVHLQMAESARRQATQLHLGSFRPAARIVQIAKPRITEISRRRVIA